MLRAGAEHHLHASELHAVERVRQFRGTLVYSSRAAIGDPHFLVNRGEVAAERDVARLEVDPHAGGFERAAAGVHLARIVAEEREVARVASGGDARRDRVEEPIHPVRREPIEVRFACGLERRLVPELRERSVAEAIENHEQDPPCIHSAARKDPSLDMSLVDGLGGARHDIVRWFVQPFVALMGMPGVASN